MRPSRKPPTTATVIEQVREIYAELEQRPIERACTAQTTCCRFRLTGKTPFLTKAEAIVLAKGWKATGRNKLPEAAADGACPLLDPRTGRCLAYKDRPFGCRTHFCQAAGGPYGRREVCDLIYRLEDISRGLGSSDAQPLPAALDSALKEMAR